LDVGMGIEPAPRHGRHAALQGQMLRCLKPYPRLLIDPDRPECDPVRIPLIGLRLVDQPRCTVTERTVDPLLPPVGRLNDVGIGGNELVGRHNATPPCGMSAAEALDNRAAQAPPMHVYRRGQHKGGCPKDNTERLSTVHLVYLMRWRDGAY